MWFREKWRLKESEVGTQVQRSRAGDQKEGETRICNDREAETEKIERDREGEMEAEREKGA